ncbi:hypothetical protein YTPLAS18_29580 [Nitrospira sp.]|nr:hypothetical protein YTPLAS18_29580 [Nitrospira sp.]
MAPSSTMKTRIRGLFLFLAIVWSIALAFLLLENYSQELVDWAFRSGTITADLGMPRASPEVVAKCAAAVRAAIESEQVDFDRRELQLAKLAAWKMGYGFGLAVGLGQAGALDVVQRNESLRVIEPMVQALRVPAPLPPALATSVTGLPEYGQSIEDDATCTALFLEEQYGASVRHIYQLGALTSFAAVYRIACPQCGVLFVPQISHHAKAAGLPEEAWQAFAQFPPNVPNMEARRKKATEIAQGLEEFIKRME